MRVKKTKIRVRLLKAYTAVLFVSFVLIGVIFNFAVWFMAEAGETRLRGAADFISRPGWILLIVVSVMFVVAVVVTYFLSNSLTRPIEKLGEFAQNIGRGDFTPNDFQFNEIELEDLNMALNKSVRQLAEYDSEQKTFFQNASHELRTPLMSIRCYAEGIAFDIMEPKTASETILQETDKLADLVTDLLYISKIDNITTAYANAEVDLTALIRDAATRQEAQAAKREIRFTFDFDEGAIYYTCVGELLARAMDNLISNAIRYATSEIVLSCHKQARQIEIRVADDGAGIAPELLPHVFERFTKGADGNHGVGLAIVKTIVEQQGGQVVVRNKAAGGAAFTITLPI